MRPCISIFSAAPRHLEFLARCRCGAHSSGPDRAGTGRGRRHRSDRRRPRTTATLERKMGPQRATQLVHKTPAGVKRSAGASWAGSH